MRKLRRLLLAAAAFGLLAFSRAGAGELFQDALEAAERAKAALPVRMMKSAPMKPTLANLFKDGQYIRISSAEFKQFLGVADHDSRLYLFGTDAASIYTRFRVAALGDDKIALQSLRGWYVSARYDNRDVPVAAYVNLRGPWETFRVIDHGNGVFSFQGSGGQCVCAQSDKQVFCDRGAIGPWEKFTVTVATNPAPKPGATVSIQALATKKYLSVQAEKGRDVLADANIPLAQERFRIVTAPDGKFAFQVEDGKFLNVNAGVADAPLMAVGEALNDWEMFDVVFGHANKDEAVYLKAANGKYLAPDAKGELRAYSDAPVAFAMKAVDAEVAPYFVPIRSKDGLECGYVKEYSNEWSSAGLGAKMDITIGRAKLPKGWVFVGDSMGMGAALPAYSSLILKDDAQNLAKPVSFTEVWNSKSTKKSCKPVVFWRPGPPAGFVALGLVVTGGAAPETVPSIRDNLRCVKESFTEYGRASLPIWTDLGSGSATPLALFAARRDDRDTSGLPPGPSSPAPTTRPPSAARAAARPPNWPPTTTGISPASRAGAARSSTRSSRCTAAAPSRAN